MYVYDYFILRVYFMLNLCDCKILKKYQYLNQLTYFLFFLNNIPKTK